ncbi:Kinase superfamily protein isoform 2 [Hibiscus syriacus]|uniref:Kinase superfamily protein isoform 2 n=2 Tax=Hibiscus syriacus TaxID=106335 RepID=A0A6A3C644_HIBSY|nr:Kinase superfamily protein isoform 2 [Hibiscus syriacus]
MRHTWRKEAHLPKVQMTWQADEACSTQYSVFPAVTERMSQQIKAPQQVPSFEYELLEGDPDQLRTVVATPTQAAPWINPSSLKLKHRIGRGPFGDVWLATHHQSGFDFQEYHEVAVKMLHPLKKEHMQKFIDKFEELFLQFRELPCVCWLHGVSVLNEKICIAMGFYEGSLGDQMAQSKGGKLSLSETLRYGIQLARGLMQLHSIGLLVLNLKPSNFLISDRDQLLLGDFGITYLLLGVPLSDSDIYFRLGTPNYMAPEQWDPEVRGPLSLETDVWGFGCSIVEMLTGVQPWFEKSIEEIYQSVVIKKEKPQIPSGLPPAVENVINGCFEYDLRNRPLVSDILLAFESSQNAIHGDGGWIGSGSRLLKEKSVIGGYTTWYLSKDRLQVGDTVRSRTSLNSRRPQTVDVREGTVVGLDGDADKNTFVLVKVPGMHNALRVQESTLERVTSGLAAGDWVRLKQETNTHSPVGILHSVQRDGTVAAGFIGLEKLWTGKYHQLQMAKPHYIGQFVRLKATVLSPRFEWPRKRGAWSSGRISEILPNGCLVVEFPGIFVFGNEPNKFLADPAEVETVSFDTCPGIDKKYQHLEDFHWAVRPLAIAFSLLTAMKLTISVGRGINARLKKDRPNSKDGARRNSGWRRMIFKDGGSTK